MVYDVTELRIPKMIIFALNDIKDFFTFSNQKRQKQKQKLFS